MTPVDQPIERRRVVRASCPRLAAHAWGVAELKRRERVRVVVEVYPERLVEADLRAQHKALLKRGKRGPYLVTRVGARSSGTPIVFAGSEGEDAPAPRW